MELHAGAGRLGSHALQWRSREPHVLLPLRSRTPRWIHLCRSAPGNHAGIGMRADNRDGMHFRAIERKYAILVFKQHRALLGQAARRFEPALYIHDTLLHGIIYAPARTLGTEHSTPISVQPRRAA